MAQDTAKSGTAPVVERVICLHHAALAADVLAEKLPTWRARIADEYPEAEPVSDWRLTVPVQNGTPDFTHVRPELSLRHRFWGPGESGGRLWCMQCLPNGVVFNVLRDKTTPHRYAELKERAMSVLPSWSEHFEVRRFNGAEVTYVNRLSAELTPQFMDSDGKLLIGRAFQLFTNIPIAGSTIVQPYDCTMTLEQTGSPSVKLTVKVVGDVNEKGPGVSIHLGCNAIPDGRGFDCLTVGNVLDIAHDRVQEAFRRLFTDEALKSFGLQQ